MAINVFDLFNAARGIEDVWEAERASNRFFDIIEKGQTDPYPVDDMASYRHYRDPWHNEPDKGRSDLEDLTATILENSFFGELEAIRNRQRPAGYEFANYDFAIEDPPVKKQEPSAGDVLMGLVEIFANSRR